MIADPDAYYEQDGAESEWYGDVPDAGWQEAPVVSSGSWLSSGCNYSEVDLLLWHRSRPESRTIGEDFSSGRRLNQEGPALGLEPGLRLTLGTFLGRDCDCRDHMLEATVLAVDQWETVDSLRSRTAQNLFSSLLPNASGFTAADTFRTAYESTLAGVEINGRIRHRLGRDALVASPDGTWTRKFTPGTTPSLLIGLRYLSVEEEFALASRRDNVSLEDFSGDYFVETNNDLVGVQIGGDCVHQHCDYFWGYHGNAGLYANFQDQTTRVTRSIDGAPFPERNESAGATDAAFVGEFGFFAGYRIMPDISLKAGYSFMYASGLALAPPQVRAETPEPRLAKGGDIFYQGLSLGLELVW